MLTQLLGVTSVPFAFIIVLVAAMALTGLWNWAIERVAYRPLRGSFRLAPLISAIGMSIFLSNMVQVIQGPRNKTIPPMFEDVIKITSGGAYDVTLSYKQILIMVSTAVLLAGFWYLVQKTPLGRAQRQPAWLSPSASDQTFSISGRPSSPVGMKIRVTARIEKAATSL